MSYSADVQIVPIQQAGGARPGWVIIVHELECSSSDKWNTSDLGAVLPKSGRIVSRKVNLIDGSAATLAPVQARAVDVVAAGPDSIAIESAVAVADGVNSALHFPFYAPDQVWFCQSRPNTGVDNEIHTEIIVVEEVAP